MPCATSRSRPSSAIRTLPLHREHGMCAICTCTAWTTPAIGPCAPSRMRPSRPCPGTTITRSSRYVPIPLCTHAPHLLKAVAPHTRIAAHYGPTNKKLRCFLPLLVPQPQPQPEAGHAADGSTDNASCYLRVADQTVRLEEGKLVIFDDSFEHEAWNLCQQPRIALIFDFWHPDLTNDEVSTAPLRAMRCS